MRMGHVGMWFSGRVLAQHTQFSANSEDITKQDKKSTHSKHKNCIHDHTPDTLSFDAFGFASLGIKPRAFDSQEFY